MNDLVDSWVDADKSLVKVVVILNESWTVPGHCNEDGVDTSTKGSQQDLASLQTNDKGKAHDDLDELALPDHYGLRAGLTG